jgi:hypothetical protein
MEFQPFKLIQKNILSETHSFKINSWISLILIHERFQYFFQNLTLNLDRILIIINFFFQ